MTLCDNKIEDNKEPTLKAHFVMKD